MLLQYQGPKSSLVSWVSQHILGVSRHDLVQSLQKTELTLKSRGCLRPWPLEFLVSWRMETPWHFPVPVTTLAVKKLFLMQVWTSHSPCPLPSRVWSYLLSQAKITTFTWYPKPLSPSQKAGSDKIWFWLICPGYSQTTSCLTKRVDMAVRRICSIRFLKAKADQPVVSPHPPPSSLVWRFLPSSYWEPSCHQIQCFVEIILTTHPRPWQGAWN